MNDSSNQVMEGGAPAAAATTTPAPAAAGGAGGGDFRMASVGKHALVYGAGVVLSKAVSFIMLPVYTNILTPADYGVMELIGLTLDIIAIVAGAKLAVGIFRYYHKAGTQREKLDVVSTAFVALSLSYAFVGLLTCAVAEPLSRMVFRTPDHAGNIRLAALALGLQGLFIVPLAYARLRDRSMMFVMANLARLAIGLGLNILLVVHMRMGVRGVFIANLAATLVVGAVLGVLLVREVGFRFTRSATRDLLRYGVPMIGTQMATFIVTFGDRYFLQAVADEAAVGIYSLAYTFGFLLAAVGYIPFEQVWEPARFEIAKRPDRDAVLSRGFTYMSLVLLSCAVGLSLYIREILQLMTGPAFWGAASLVPLILLAFVLQGWASIFDIGILMRERTEFVTLANWCAAGVALLSYWVLIPRYHGLGAAMAAPIAVGTRFALIYIFSQRLWPVRYDWAPVLKICVLAVATVAAGMMVDAQSIWTSLGVKTLLLLGYAAALWHIGVLSVSDRLWVRRLIHSPRAALASLRG